MMPDATLTKHELNPKPSNPQHPQRQTDGMKMPQAFMPGHTSGKKRF